MIENSKFDIIITEVIPAMDSAVRIYRQTNRIIFLLNLHNPLFIIIDVTDQSSELP